VDGNSLKVSDVHSAALISYYYTVAVMGFSLFIYVGDSTHADYDKQARTVLVNTNTIHPQIRMVNVEMMRQVSYGEVLGDKGAVYIRVTLY